MNLCLTGSGKRGRIGEDVVTEATMFSYSNLRSGFFAQAQCNLKVIRY